MKKEVFSIQDYFSHIKKAIDKIEQYIATVNSYEDFLATPMVGDAVIRNIEVIGEASNNIRRIYPEFTKQNPEIAKTLGIAYNMRNAVIHGYIEVDYEIVYETAKYSIIEFKRQIENTQNIEQEPPEPELAM